MLLEIPSLQKQHQFQCISNVVYPRDSQVCHVKNCSDCYEPALETLVDIVTESMKTSRNRKEILLQSCTDVSSGS